MLIFGTIFNSQNKRIVLPNKKGSKNNSVDTTIALISIDHCRYLENDNILGTNDLVFYEI